MHSRHITANGKTFHLLEAGPDDAPPLLFLHGFPEYCGAWSEVIAHLSDDFRCLAPDQRGYGDSWRGGDVADYEMKHLRADCIAMIDQLCDGRTVLLGHDWGASVAYATAIRAPEKVSHLVIANGAHPGPFAMALAAGGAQSEASQYIDWLRRDGSEQALAADDFDLMFGLFSRHMAMDWLTPDKRAAYARAWRDADGVRAMVNWYRATPFAVAQPGHPLPVPDMPADSLHIPMPHLLIWGENDKALLSESRAGLETYCADLTVETYPDADHWILHQKPAEVAARIRAFLRDRPLPVS